MEEDEEEKLLLKLHENAFLRIILGDSKIGGLGMGKISLGVVCFIVVF
jgi:hypothetical protein